MDHISLFAVIALTNDLPPATTGFTRQSVLPPLWPTTVATKRIQTPLANLRLLPQNTTWNLFGWIARLCNEARCE